MTKRNPILSPLAGTAIAAVLALSATPAAAQDAAVPEPVLAPSPAAQPAAAPPPVERAPVLTSQPVVQAVPDMPEPAASTSALPVAAAPATRAASTRAASTRAAATQSAAIAPAATQPVLAAPTTPDLAPAAIPAVAGPAPVADQPAPIVATQPQDSGLGTELGLGFLGLAALGGAYALSRRRKFAPVRVAASTPVKPLDRPIAMPQQRTEITFDRQAPFAAPAAYAQRPELASAAAIPAGPLPTGAAMAELYHRMVAAAPDASNPFTSVKRRGKRARWLLKQHEYALDRQNAAGFDFRRYEPSSTLRQQQSGLGTLQPA